MLILNEGARTRIAEVCVGVFAIVEMVAFQSLVSKIPAVVFSGVPLKVGHDVSDDEPVFNYVRCTLMRRAHPGGSSPVVSHFDVLFILGTTIVTIAVNLNIADLLNERIRVKKNRAGNVHTPQCQTAWRNFF